MLSEMLTPVQFVASIWHFTFLSFLCILGLLVLCCRFKFYELRAWLRLWIHSSLSGHYRRLGENRLPLMIKTILCSFPGVEMMERVTGNPPNARSYEADKKGEKGYERGAVQLA